MKRLILLSMVCGLVFYAIRSHGVCPLGRRLHDVHIHDARFSFAWDDRPAVRAQQESARQAREDADEARREALEAIREARREVDEAAREAAREAKQAMKDAAREFRESVDGIPVPIVPGTRTTHASAAAPQPPAPPRPPHGSYAAPRPPAPPRPIHFASHPSAAPLIRKVAGRISADEQRARDDARRQLQEDVADWLKPYVATSWRPSEQQIDQMIVQTRLSPVEKPYATLYVAELDADFSDARRDDMVRSHQQIVVRDRMLKLAGLLGFTLVCLAAVSGYIRTDEATKGYYTNRLRMLAAAGVGAAGAVIYQMIS